MDDHGVHVGNVQPRLDDGGGNQHVDLPVDEIVHDPFQLMLLHLPVGKGHVRLRHQLLNRRRHVRDGVHPVIDIVHLPVSGKLPDDGLPHHFLVVLAHKGLDGLAVPRRFLQHAHVPDADQRHVQGAGDGRGGQRQHVHVLLQLLDLFLVRHAEALLLVDDQKAQILKLNIRG